MVRIISFLTICFLVLFGFTFAILNAEPVTLNYYIGTRILPLSLLLALALFFGALLGLLTSFTVWLRIKHENHKLRRRVNLAEREVENLRAIPLRDEH